MRPPLCPASAQLALLLSPWRTPFSSHLFSFVPFPRYQKQQRWKNNRRVIQFPLCSLHKEPSRPQSAQAVSWTLASSFLLPSFLLNYFLWLLRRGHCLIPIMSNTKSAVRSCTSALTDAAALPGCDVFTDSSCYSGLNGVYFCLCGVSLVWLLSLKNDFIFVFFRHISFSIFIFCKKKIKENLNKGLVLLRISRFDSISIRFGEDSSIGVVQRSVCGRVNITVRYGTIYKTERP